MSLSAQAFTGKGVGDESVRAMLQLEKQRHTHVPETGGGATRRPARCHCEQIACRSYFRNQSNCDARSFTHSSRPDDEERPEPFVATDFTLSIPYLATGSVLSPGYTLMDTRMACGLLRRFRAKPERPQSAANRRPKPFRLTRESVWSDAGSEIPVF